MKVCVRFYLTSLESSRSFFSFSLLSVGKEQIVWEAGASYHTLYSSEYFSDVTNVPVDRKNTLVLKTAFLHLHAVFFSKFVAVSV